MSDILTLDFETYYSKDYSLSKMTTESYIRSPLFETIGVAVKRASDARPLWCTGTDQQIFDFLDSYDLHQHKVVCHHAAFDGAILSWRYGLHPKMLLDTLSMAKPKFGTTVGGSLAKLAKYFGLGEKGTEVVQALGKRRADFTPQELAQYGVYCCNDVTLTEKLLYALMPYVTPQELYIIDLLLRMYTDPVLELDSDLLERHLVTVQAEKEDLLAKLDATIGKAELMSNPKLAMVLETLGVTPPMKFNAKGKETFAFAKTDQAFLDLQDHPDIRVQTVVAARLGVKSTLEETRTMSLMAIAVRGTLPVPVGYYNAHTGRAGGWDKINMQNMTRGGNLRRSVKPPKGHKIIAGDSAQIECRVVAWLAGQDDLVEAFANGEDIYSIFASEIYQREVQRKRMVLVDGEKTYPDFEAGFVGKTAILGLGFGMGAPRFRDDIKVKGSIDMSENEARNVVGLYRSKYRKIVALWRAANLALEEMAAGRECMLGIGIKLRCTADGVELPNGMMLYYPNLRLKRFEDGETSYVYDGRFGVPIKIHGAKLIENIVQALARIIVFNQMCKIDQQLQKYDLVWPQQRFKVAGTVHDEVINIAPDWAVKKVKDMVERIMTMVPKWASGLPIACEVKSGDDYASCK